MTLSFKDYYYFFFCPTVFLITALIPVVEVVVHKKRKSKRNFVTFRPCVKQDLAIRTI